MSFLSFPRLGLNVALLTPGVEAEFTSSQVKSILYLPSDCRVAFITASITKHFNSTNSKMGKDQTTTPGTLCPTLYDECMGSLTSLADHNSEDAGDRAYSLSSLSEMTGISNH